MKLVRLVRSKQTFPLRKSPYSISDWVGRIASPYMSCPDGTSIDKLVLCPETGQAAILVSYDGEKCELTYAGNTPERADPGLIASARMPDGTPVKGAGFCLRAPCIICSRPKSRSWTWVYLCVEDKERRKIPLPVLSFLDAIGPGV